MTRHTARQIREGKTLASSKALPSQPEGSVTAYTMEEMRSLLRSASPYLPMFDEAVMWLVIAVAVALSLIRQSFLFYGQALTASVVAYALAYILTTRTLRKRGVGVERVFISLAAMISGIMLYEIIYHFTYRGAQQTSSVVSSLLTFSSSSASLIFSLILVLIVFVGVRYMRPNRYFFLTVVLSYITFGLWSAIGFPQFFANWYPNSEVVFVLPFYKTNVPLLNLYGFVFNSITKFPVALIPASLFLWKERTKESKPAGSQQVA